MFEATDAVLLLDYFRVPYRLGAPAEGLPAGARAVRYGERALAWPGAAELAERGLPRGEAWLGGIPLFCAVLPDGLVASRLDAAGGEWSPHLAIDDPRGRRLGSIWKERDGSVFLPFDPDDAIHAFWSEDYKRVGRRRRARVRAAANAAYYRVRPAIPRRAQIALRRLASRAQSRTAFPRWPVEPGLHELYDFLFGLLGEVAREPVPWIAPWPNGYSWALVLTHDVETQVGYEHLDLLRDVELESGCRSAWNFVPRRYAVDDETVRRLTDEGFEVGVHGLYHDGRDVSPATLPDRLPGIREAADRWRASGFRAPATRRVWELMPRLGFDYDSSYPDTDPFEPDGGGCCTWLPFFNGATVELPITLPQDYTVFTILQEPDESLWLAKAEELRRRGGLALLITHPDYMLGAAGRDAYRRFIEAFAGDETAWGALPREVAGWWRRRAVSSLEQTDGSWRVVGPAAGEARVVFAPAYGSRAGAAEPVGPAGGGLTRV
jgi:hypothetical protein